MERQDRERRKEEERLMREKQREEERSKREQRREMERREKFLQKESLRVSEEPTSVSCSLFLCVTVDKFLLYLPVVYLKAEKKRQKEELRKEREAVRRKAALEKATARRIARESMELIEDEQLELMEMAAARKGLSSIVSLDHDTLQSLDSLRGWLALPTIRFIYICIYFFLS